MTIDELVEKIQLYKDIDPAFGNSTIMIAIEGTSIGYSPAVAVNTIYQGFDWNRGRVFIKPEIPLQKVPNEDKETDR